VCQRCHNEETQNHPELPAKANDILDRFHKINSYYRYIGSHSDPTDIQAFFAVMDKRIRELSVLWHTFDLPTIDKETRFILDLLKAKSVEVRNLQRAEQP